MKNSREKNTRRHVTAFYMETLILTVVFIMVILVLTKIFALSGQLSAKARILTNAVHLAENAAEAVAGADSAQRLLGLLNENGNTKPLEGEADTVFRAQYDMDGKPAAEGSFWVDVSWVPEKESEGGLVKSRITVYWDREEEPVYTLDTAVYLQEALP